MRKEGLASFKLAIPIILGEVAQISLHLIDTAMVGRVSYLHLGASSLTSNVINIPFILGIGLTIAIAQMTSLYHGRNDHKNVSHYLFNGMFIILLAALIISVGMFFGSGILYSLKQDPEVVDLAIPYFKIMTWSLIPGMLFIALKQYTDGLQYTRTAMILALAALPVNVFLNWLLIFGNWGFPRLELIGAGWATFITRTLIFIILVLIVFIHPIYKKHIKIAPRAWQLNKSTIKDILKIGVPSSMQVTMESGAFAVSGIIIGTISAVALAAHQIALSIAAFTFVINMGMSHAISIRTSNAYSQNDWKKIDLIGRSGMRMTIVYGIMACLSFLIFRYAFAGLFTQNEEVTELAVYLLILAAIFQVPDTVQVNSAGLLRGIKDVNTPTLIVAIAYWIIAIPLGSLLAFYFDRGAEGIWIGLIAGLTFSSIFLTKRFFGRVKWNLKKQNDG